MPTQGRYRELTSTSNCTEYQARRLNIRERMEDGGTRAVSTLNGTLATTRWLVAILENHQQKDGSIVIPQAMRAYMGGKEVIEPTKWEADRIWVCLAESDSLGCSWSLVTRVCLSVPLSC